MVLKIFPTVYDILYSLRFIFPETQGESLLANRSDGACHIRLPYTIFTIYQGLSVLSHRVADCL